MSPRGSSNAATSPSSRPSTAPYARRSTSQPKSSRQQFSACGACRMRRVRCDLKDLPAGFVGPHPACSNCKERGIKCVDEFADVKAVKLLRRGRRLQQVEAIYGKTSDQDGNSSSMNLSRTITIPTLHTEFFASSFWRWFSIQRPILDPKDFPARFAAHLKGSQTLTSEGALIAMLLVTWAASFGLNERGHPESAAPQGEQSNIASPGSSTHPVFGDYPPPGSKRRQWKMKTETYIREILELIDLHGVLRRPTLDGVRVLLLLLPLLEDAQPLERLVIYEATFSQVQALCVVSAVSPPNFEDAVTRARLFWYAYTQEGVLTGVRGGRFVLNNEDLDTFQRTLPPADHPSPSSPPLDAVPNMSPYHLQESSNPSPQELALRKGYLYMMHAAAAPLDLSNVCRKIHGVLTGIKAAKRAEEHHLIDANGMRDIWRGLDRCWQELESMKPLATERDARSLELSRYVSGWQIFIFECHNVIRECLKHFAIAASGSQVMYDPSGSSSRPSSHSSSSSPYLSPQHLHVAANRRCHALLPRIINIIRAHSPREHGDSPCIFRWDANLVRDGVFFAAYLVANMDGEFVDMEDSENPETRELTVDEGVSICLTALATMRWGFSKSEEREDTIKMVWESHKLRRQGQVHHLPLYDSEYPQSTSLPGLDMHLNLSPSPHMSLSTTSSEERPMLPPLNLFISQRRVESAPSTACSTDDRGTNWPSYTPPGTGTSVATSTGTGYSRRGSPVFANMGSFKASDDVFYHGSTDVDQFTYNVPVAGSMIRESSGIVSNVAYGHRPSSMGAQTLSASNATNYMFGENCNGAYH